MKTEYFQFDPIEYAAVLTHQHQQTLGYLLGKGHISPEVYDELIDSTIVSPIKNYRHFGRRLLEKFFPNKKDDEGTYSFVIAEIAEVHETTPTPKKTKLEKVVDNEK